ncbi:MAG: serine hydrolase [Chloroflexi bacterium]|nr:serine hydrolase [Chloroflexota bacterium]
MLVLPIAALCAIGIGAVWLHFAGGAQAVRASQAPDSTGGIHSAATGPMLQGPTPATPIDASASAQRPATPLMHQWQASPGIQLDSTLAGLLDEAVSGVDGHVGVAVKDLGSGKGAVLNGSDELQSASLYKLPILYAVFDSGISFSEQLPISEEARSYDAGTMELGVGESLSVAEALERMVTLSDNTAAVMLGSRVGAAEVNASIRVLGMDTTHYSLDRMTSSALDMESFLETVARGRAVSPGDSADMVHLLLRQRVNDRIPRLLPDGVQVAHKTGNLPGVVNDVGLLYGPNSTVALAVLVSDTTDETAAATAIARLALAAYSYFDAQPPASDRPLIPPAPSRPIPPVWRQPNPPVLAVATEPIRTQRSDAVPAALVATADTPARTPVATAGTAATAPIVSTTTTAATTPSTPTPAAASVPTSVDAHTVVNARAADTPTVRFTDTPIPKPTVPPPPTATSAPAVPPTLAPTQPAAAPTPPPATPKPATPRPAAPTATASHR